MKNNRIAVMASGKGTNLRVILQAIEQGTCPATVACVICNKEDAAALSIARQAGVPHVFFLNPKDYDNRKDFDEACAKVIQEAGCHWVVLAGYMRILSAEFIQNFPNRIVNIHPSLLPAFIGADAVGAALEHGVKVTGCTVHLVNEDLDGGPILAQTSVEVFDDDNWHTLHQRIQVEEHRLFPETIARLLTTDFTIDGRCIIW